MNECSCGRTPMSSKIDPRLGRRGFLTGVVAAAGAAPVARQSLVAQIAIACSTAASKEEGASGAGSAMKPPDAAAACLDAALEQIEDNVSLPQVGNDLGRGHYVDCVSKRV